MNGCIIISRMVSTEAKNGYIYIDLFKIIDTPFIMDVIGTLLIVTYQLPI